MVSTAQKKSAYVRIHQDVRIPTRSTDDQRYEIPGLALNELEERIVVRAKTTTKMIAVTCDG